MPSLLRSAALRLLCLALAFVPGAGASGAAFEAPAPRVSKRDPGPSSKPQWGQLVVRSSTFREMLRGAQTQGCAAHTPPEPIATSAPVLDAADKVRLTVNFIVGTDGRVYSPLILEEIQLDQARLILDTVRRWRFRPAVCNGAPAEAEAKVEFSSPPNRF